MRKVVTKPSPRLLLCRPQAGLTDTLCQIGKCLRYADKFGRKIVVEMDFPGAVHFRDDFSIYFTSHDSRLILSSKGFRPQFDNLQAFPSSLSGRVNSYVGVWKKKFENIVDAADDQLLSFDFRKNYTQPLLVHHAAGGGMRNVKVALRRLSVTKLIQDEVRLRTALIGGPYTSLHIRYTDYVTDFQDRLLELKEKISGPIFLATDNRKALEICQKLFGKKRVFSFAKFPKVDGQPIHSDMKMNAKTSNVDAICDVIMLATAKTYYFFPLIATHRKWVNFSSFSEFAQMLHSDEQLLKHFLGVQKFSAVARVKFRFLKFCRQVKGSIWSLMPSHRG